MPSRSPRGGFHAGRGVVAVVSLATVTSVARAAMVASLATVATVVTLALAPTPSAAIGPRPPEILSWRHQILDEAEYQKLAEQWGAYATANPKDARALVEWGNALRYCGGQREEAEAKYRQAFAVDSLDAGAVEAYAVSVVSLHDEGTAWKEAHQMLVRSLARDSSYTKTYYALWYSSLRAGDTALSDRCLRMMVESGDMPRPLLDYGGNMVEGAPPDAIILTNGDNDTYPPLAYQVRTGRRRDVTIANRSLLNAAWYIRYLKDEGLPITLSDKEINAFKPASTERLPADLAIENLAANLMKSGGRPLLYAVSVPPGGRHLTTGECLGFLVPVVGGPLAEAEIKKGSEANEAPCDWSRTRDLLDTVYRTEGAIDPLIDWQRESAVARLVPNYVALNCGVAEWLMGSGQKDEAGRYYARAVRLLAFHQDREHGQQVVDDWAKADPQSRLLPVARELLSE